MLSLTSIALRLGVMSFTQLKRQLRTRTAWRSPPLHAADVTFMHVCAHLVKMMASAPARSAVLQEAGNSSTSCPGRLTSTTPDNSMPRSGGSWTSLATSPPTWAATQIRRTAQARPPGRSCSPTARAAAAYAAPPKHTILSPSIPWPAAITLSARAVLASACRESVQTGSYSIALRQCKSMNVCTYARTRGVGTAGGRPPRKQDEDTSYPAVSTTTFLQD